MERAAQVIDMFRSRGKLVLTMWDLSQCARFTIRLSKPFDVEMGEVLLLSRKAPKIRRLSVSRIPAEMADNAVLPIAEPRILEGAGEMKKSA